MNKELYYFVYFISAYGSAITKDIDRLGLSECSKQVYAMEVEGGASMRHFIVGGNLLIGKVFKLIVSTLSPWVIGHRGLATAINMGLFSNLAKNLPNQNIIPTVFLPVEIKSKLSVSKKIYKSA